MRTIIKNVREAEEPMSPILKGPLGTVRIDLISLEHKRTIVPHEEESIALGSERKENVQQ